MVLQKRYIFLASLHRCSGVK